MQKWPRSDSLDMGDSMIKSHWIDYFWRLATEVATKSKDDRKVGALLIADDLSIRSTGFNGFPRGCSDHPTLYEDRDTKLRRVVHAEANAIVQAAKSGTSTDGCTLVVNWHPCSQCAALIINAGIKRVICAPVDHDSKWLSSFTEASRMFNEADIEVIHWTHVR